MKTKDLTKEREQEQEQLCRICFTAGEQELITPCQCKGSQKYIHKACLKRWQESIRTNTCSVCKTEFKIKLNQKAKKKEGWTEKILKFLENKRLWQALFITVMISLILWPLNTLATIGGIMLLIPTLVALYWIYHYFRGIIITPQFENGRMRILFMRQGDPVNYMRPGMLLRAPDSGGEIFRNATVLIWKYSAQEGSFGWILNKEIHGIRIGGPVSLNLQFVLHNIEDVEGKQEVIPGVYIGGNITETINQRGLQNGEHVHFIRGCAGWAPRQLDGELRENMWELIGEATADRVWLELMS